jgi:hypothetical protein
MSEKVTLSEDQWTDAIRKHYVSLGDDEGQGVHPYYKAAFKDGVNFARALLASSPECGSGDADKRVARDESLRGEVAYQLQVRNRWLDMPTMRSIVDSAFNAAIATTIAPIATPPAQPAQDERGALTKERIAKIAADFYDAGDGDTEHGCFDIDGFADALARAAASPVSGAANIRHWRNRIIKAMRAPSRGDFTIALDVILKEMTEEIERIDRDAAKGEQRP